MGVRVESTAMPRRRAVLAAIGSGLLAGCTGDETPAAGEGSLTVSSSAFGEGESIPQQYTTDGADVSPPLSIGGVPDAAASLVLVMDDPDAPSPPFTHWLCWGIPPDTTSIPADIQPAGRVEALGDAIQGQNDFGDLGYGGPAPPEGDGPHRYRFTLRAVEAPLGLDPGAGRNAVDEALAEGVIASGQLVGTYER